MAKKTQTFQFKKLQKAVDALNQMEIFEDTIDLTVLENTDEQVEAFLQLIEEGVDKELEGALPDIVINLYNAFVDAQEEKKTIVFEYGEPEKKKEAKKEKKKNSKKPQKAEKSTSKEKDEPELEKEQQSSKKAKNKPKKSMQEDVTEKKSEEPKKSKKSKKSKKVEKTEKAEKTEKKEDKNSKTKKEIQKDVLGARVGSGTSKINEMLLKGADVKDIAEKIGTPLGRVKNHVYALMKREEKNYKIKKEDDFVKITLLK